MALISRRRCSISRVYNIGEATCQSSVSNKLFGSICPLNIFDVIVRDEIMAAIVIRPVSNKRE